jgi:putative oxidoreductase
MDYPLSAASLASCAPGVLMVKGTRFMAVSLSLSLLILRLVGGLTIAAHGAQKLFGWFDGPGFATMAQSFQGQGLRPGWLWTCLVITGEFGGGLSVAFGFLTPLGGAGMFGAMLMAIGKSHWKNGFFNAKRGIEFPLTLLTIGVAIGVAGPGTYSLDTLLGISLPQTLLFGVLAVAAVLVDGIGLRISRRSAPVPSSHPSV